MDASVSGINGGGCKSYATEYFHTEDDAQPKRSITVASQQAEEQDEQVNAALAKARVRTERAQVERQMVKDARAHASRPTGTETVRMGIGAAGVIALTVFYAPVLATLEVIGAKAGGSTALGLAVLAACSPAPKDICASGAGGSVTTSTAQNIPQAWDYTKGIAKAVKWVVGGFTNECGPVEALKFECKFGDTNEDGSAKLTTIPVNPDGTATITHDIDQGRVFNCALNGDWNHLVQLYAPTPITTDSKSYCDKQGGIPLVDGAITTSVPDGSNIAYLGETPVTFTAGNIHLCDAKTAATADDVTVIWDFGQDLKLSSDETNPKYKVALDPATGIWSVTVPFAAKVTNAKLIVIDKKAGVASAPYAVELPTFMIDPANCNYSIDPVNSGKKLPIISDPTVSGPTNPAVVNMGDTVTLSATADFCGNNDEIQFQMGEGSSALFVAATPDGKGGFSYTGTIPNFLFTKVYTVARDKDTNEIIKTSQGTPITVISTAKPAPTFSVPDLLYSYNEEQQIQFNIDGTAGADVTITWGDGNTTSDQIPQTGTLPVTYTYHNYGDFTVQIDIIKDGVEGTEFKRGLGINAINPTLEFKGFSPSNGQCNILPGDDTCDVTLYVKGGTAKQGVSVAKVQWLLGNETIEFDPSVASSSDGSNGTHAYNWTAMGDGASFTGAMTITLAGTLVVKATPVDSRDIPGDQIQKSIGAN